jgi:hypothetical protein
MLSHATTRSIESMVDEAFDNAKEIFLGIASPGKRLTISTNQTLTLPALFEAVSREDGGVPNTTTLNSLITVASNYIESTRANTKANIINQIQGFIDEGQFSEENDVKLKEKIKESLGGILNKAAEDLNKIFDSELTKTRNFASLDGIVRVNAVQEVSDPVVFWIVTRGGDDGHPCKECRRLHLMPDGITPRLWKMSSVSYQYHKMGEDKPSICGEHPYCMCTITTLLPGFGFGKDGRVEYKAYGFDAFAEQN